MSITHSQYFNARAATWDTLIDADTRMRLADIIKELQIQPGAMVLDVGTGTGVLLPFLKEAVGARGRVVALDIAEEMLIQARQQHHDQDIEYILGDIGFPPFPADSFDEIICNACFPHVTDKLGAVKQMARILKPGGRAVICHTMSREAINRFHRSLEGIVAQDRLPGDEDMQQIFTRAGMVEITIIDVENLYLLTARKPLCDQAHPGNSKFDRDSGNKGVGAESQSGYLKMVCEAPRVEGAIGREHPLELNLDGKIWNQLMPPVAADSLVETSRGYHEPFLLYDALRIGIFDALGEQNRTAEALATAIGAVTVRLVFFLDALVSLEWLEKEDGVYRNSMVARTYLWSESKFYMGDLLDLQLAPVKRQLWEKVGDWALGKTAIPNRFKQPAAVFNAAFIRAMAQSALGQPDFIHTVALVANHPGFDSASKLLDLGGGHGLFAIALKLMKPGLTASVFDLPHVEPVMREYADNYQVDIGFYPGNFHEDELPGHQDLILAFDMLYPSHPRNHLLLVKIHRALNPGGYLFTRHWLLDPTRTWPRRAALFALQSKLGNPQSHVYERLEMNELLADAGLEVEQSHLLGAASSTLIVARKA